MLLRDVVHLEENLGGDGVEVDPLTCVRRVVGGTLYEDDAGLLSKSAEGLAKTMTVNVTVFEAAGLTVSEKENGDHAAAGTERTRHLRPHRSSSKHRDGGIDRQRSFCAWAVLSQALTSCQRSHDGPDSHGYVTIGSNGSCRIWRKPRSL